jgi:hypothetical protein
MDKGPAAGLGQGDAVVRTAAAPPRGQPKAQGGRAADGKSLARVSATEMQVLEQARKAGMQLMATPQKNADQDEEDEPGSGKRPRKRRTLRAPADRAMHR